jgi:hypothetical protein
MTLPASRDDRMYGIVACIFGDEDFANGSRIEAVKAFKGRLEQIKTATAGNH